MATGAASFRSSCRPLGLLVSILVAGLAGPAHAQTAKQASATTQPAKSKASKPSSGAATSSSVSEQAIVVLVNDEPVTAYEVEQRARLNSLSANIGERAQENFKRLVSQESTNNQLKEILNRTIQENQGKTREQILAIFEERKKAFAMNLQRQALDSARVAAVGTQRKGALEELIEERLKLQEAKRMNTLADDAEVEKVIKNLADRNKLTVDQFSQNLKNMGADVAAMRARFKATLSWNEVIRRKFGYQVSVTQRDVDRLVAKTAAATTEDQVELQIQRITFAVAKLDQKHMAERLQDAEAAKAKFTTCSEMGGLAKGVAGAKFEKLGEKRLSNIPEPTRSLMANAKDGEVLPPSVAQGGVELYAVCGRKVVKAAEEKVAQAQEELRQREFELLSRRHLKDLRQDATIEYR